VFSALDARDAVRGARVLDLYAGSGALGLEAASRGAARVVLVESDRRAVDVIAVNARELKLPGTRVVRSTVAAHLSPDPEPDEPSDLVFVDPPYDLDDTALSQVLDRLRAGWLAPRGLLVVERSTRSPEPTWPDGIELATKPKKYGETTIWYATRD
jgi:16S rRNA (guanine966-N2)-methyltransferase